MRADNFNMGVRQGIIDGRKMLGLTPDLEKEPPLIPLNVLLSLSLSLSLHTPHHSLSRSFTRTYLLVV